MEASNNLAEFECSVEVNGAMVRQAVTLTAAGEFRVDFGNERYPRSFPTLDAVKEAMKRNARVKKVEHAIPIVINAEGLFNTENAFARAILRGVNQRTGEALVTDSRGEKESIKHLDILCLGDEITDEQIAHLNVLQAAKREATWALREAVKGFTEPSRRRRGGRYLNADSLIEEATEKALGKPTA